jgi:hypothetical protein
MLGKARPASLVSAIAIEAIWDRGKRFPMRVVICVELPNAREDAIVAYCPMCGPNADPHDRHSVPAGDEIEVSTVSRRRQDRSFLTTKSCGLSGQFVPAFQSLSPKFFVARLHCVKTNNNSSSIVPPKVERAENIKAAAASSLDNAKMFVGEGALRLA